jgi:hypothetical protein
MKLFITLGGVWLALIGFCSLAPAQNLDQIGVTWLRAMTTNLNGAGLRVAQAEADLATNPPTWEVNPADVGQRAALFSYFSADGSATSYPNNLGTNSSHAESVADNYYGQPNGVATNIAHLDNYQADYFYDSVIDGLFPTNIVDVIVNQSFIFDGSTVSEQEESDSAYDNYAVKFNTLFVSGVGNSGPISPPATCYNGLGVGVSDGSSSYGPTPDNGRSKPDLIAPGGATSFSTPYVAGAAAVLMQAALRGDGGSTNAAADLRTLKALLLNGTVKPVGWTNSPAAPLDTRYGAGVLNVFNAYEQLAGGKQPFIASTSVSHGDPHPPTGATGTVGARSGWDFNSLTSSASTDAVNHYYFNVTNGSGSAPWAATITLVWNRPQSPSPDIHSAINVLNLFLYNAANSNLVLQSTSQVDNVQHLFVPRLAPGRYDVQVWKAGGPGIVSASESYGLAWAWVAPVLSLARTGAGAMLTWPAYPAGYGVEATTNLSAPAWSTNGLPATTLANGTNAMAVPLTNGPVFYRLSQPGN